VECIKSQNPLLVKRGEDESLVMVVRNKCVHIASFYSINNTSCIDNRTMQGEPNKNTGSPLYLFIFFLVHYVILFDSLIAIFALI
jgi:hypothetical protein